MKRMISLLLALVCICGIAGCAAETPPESPVAFYYRCSEIGLGAPEGVMQAEQRDAAGHEDEYEYLLNIYVKGPKSSHLAPTFPLGTKILRFSLENNRASITLSDNFSILTGMDLTVACVCLTRTVIEMTGCEQVTLRARTTNLDGNKFITFGKDSYLLLDSYPTKK